MAFLASFLPGYGAVAVESLTSTGNIATTAGYIEFPADAAGPRVRCGTDTDTGIGRTAANQVSVWANGGEKLYVTSSQILADGTTELVTNGEMETRGKRVRTKRSQAISAASATIDPSFGLQEVVEVTLPSGNITITATPFIANGDDGQELTIVNVQAASTLTLPDEATTAGCNLELRSATRVLAAGGGYICLRYSSALAAWHEIGFG